MFNFIGDVSSKLFGVATQEDLNILSDAVRQLAEQNVKIVHDRELQISWINRTRHEVRENRELVNAVVAHINHIQSDFQQSVSRTNRLEQGAQLKRLFGTVERQRQEASEELCIDQAVEAFKKDILYANLLSLADTVKTHE